jgi:hypothetical protein
MSSKFRDSTKHPGENKEIAGLYVFLGAAEDGSEGIIAQMMPDGRMYPMLATTRSMLTMMEPTAQAVADKSGSAYSRPLRARPGRQHRHARGPGGR